MSSSSEGVGSEFSSSGYPRQWAEEELGQSAYERTLPEMLAIPEREVMTVNLNLTEVIATGLGVVPQVQAYREALVRSCADCRFDWVDGLEDSILALNYARAEYLTVTRPQRCPAAVWAEARLVRRVLMHDCRALAARGVLNKAMLRGVQKGRGFLELGTDLTVLAHALRAYARSEGGEVPAQVERAMVLAKAILTAGGRPNPKAETVVRARDLQNRAFTICMWRYNETRASVAYMRRDQGDVDRIVPSLYSARRARSAGSDRRKATNDAEAAPVVAAPMVAQPIVAQPAVAAPTVAPSAAVSPIVGERGQGDERELERKRARDRLIAVGPFEEEPVSAAPAGRRKNLPN